MKRIAIAGVLAVALTAASGQEASAWTKFNFGFGFNIGCESANNNVLCGLYKSGPAPYDCGSGGCGYGAPMGGGYDVPAFPASPLPAPTEDPKKKMSYADQPPYGSTPAYTGTQPIGYYPDYGYPMYWYAQ